MIGQHALNKILANFEAGGSSLYFGTQTMRRGMTQGFRDLRTAGDVVRNMNKAHAEKLKGIDSEIARLEQELNAGGLNKKQIEARKRDIEMQRAEREKMVKQHEEVMRQHYEDRAKKRVGAINTIVGGAYDWAIGADYEGQGARRVGAVAARIGGTGAAWMGANIGFRYLRGGTATRNPNGERDIAGMPLF